MTYAINANLAEPDLAAIGVKKVVIHYFAALREQVGRQLETIETRAVDATALYAELQAQKPIRLSPSFIKVAINGEFATWDHPIGDGDHVVFIPPVAGG